MKLLQLVRRPNVRVQNLNLKLGGKLRGSGRLFALLTVAWLAFTAHSAFVQWHRGWGGFHLDRTEATKSEVFGGAHHQGNFSRQHYESAEKLTRHFALADRWGLVDVVEVKLGLAWGHLLEGDIDAAEEQIRATLAINPDNPGVHRDLFDLLIRQGRLDAAIEARRDHFASGGASATDQLQLAGLLAEAGRFDEAAAEFRSCIERGLDSLEIRYNLGGVLRRSGRNAEAIEQFEAALALAPADPDTHIELGLALADSGDKARAIEMLRRAIELAPDRPESRMHLPRLIEQLQQSPGP